MNLLTLLIFLPIVFGVAILVMPSGWRAGFKYVTLLATILQLAISLFIYANFKTGAGYGGVNQEGQFQLLQKLHWINLDLGSIGKMQIDYVVGVDGISIALLVMTSVVLVIAVLASWEIKIALQVAFDLPRGQ